MTGSDGQTASGTSSTFSFTPTDDGTYTVSLTATDKDGKSGTDTKTVTVTAKSPTASITGAPTTSVVEGTSVSVGSTVTDGMDADTPITYAWSVTSSNGQSASGTSSTFSFTPTDDGTYTVSLTATDKRRVGR